MSKHLGCCFIWLTYFIEQGLPVNWRITRQIKYLLSMEGNNFQLINLLDPTLRIFAGNNEVTHKYILILLIKFNIKYSLKYNFSY